MSESDYLKGGVSILRNATIANIFYRLEIIETFGTGVDRIKRQFEKYEQQPIFSITGTTISVTLPVIEYV